MAYIDYWIGDLTQNTAAIVYRATSNGDVTVTVNGSTTSAMAADTDVDDGLVRIDVTGLSANTTYTYSINLDGVEQVSNSFKTPGANTVKIAFLSCFKDMATNALFDVIAEYDPHILVLIGDVPYMDTNFGTARTRWGITRKGISDYIFSDSPTDAEITRNLYDGHLFIRRHPGLQREIRRRGTLWAASDHEAPGNDGSPSDTGAWGVNGTKTIVANDTENQDLWTLCRNAYAAYYMGNPANADANNDSNFDNDRQTYFRTKVNDNTEIFMLDALWYIDPEQAYGGGPYSGDRAILGATQKAWLETQLAATTADFKPLFTERPFNQGGVDTQGSTEITSLTSAIDTASGWAKAGGVIAGAGDLHCPFAGTVKSTYHELCASPALSSGTGLHTLENGREWIQFLTDDTPAQSDNLVRRVFGLMDIDGGVLTASIIDDGGNILYKCLLDSGTNAVRYPTTKTA